MSEKLYPFDAADYLDGAEAIQIFLEDAFETGNAAYIESAFAVVARAKAMRELGLEHTLDEQPLGLKSMLSILKTLNLSLSIKHA